MEITTKKNEICTVVEVKGRLDTTNYLELENELNIQIQKGEHSILVDCGALDYVSSSGLRVFLIAFKELNKLKGKFVLCNLHESILEIFEISGFVNIFSVYSTRQEALDACSN